MVLPSAAQTRPARVTIIEIDGEPVTETWRFAPASFTVSEGTRVTWLNTGRSYHTVTSPEGLFDSGYLESGQSWSYEFNTPGVYNYFCVPYPWMKGTVIVR
jgi:plastocyanin